MPKAEAVRSLFSNIAGRYDLANRLLSGGCDLWWRRVLIRKVAACHPRRVIDLATGSGDVAFALKRKLGTEVVVEGYDFCQPMLDEAIKKREAHKSPPDISFTQADILNMPLKNAYADVATVAFGVRNLENRKQGLEELRRILRPGGSLFVLEFTQPQRWFRPVYYLYLKYILPVFAALITGDKGAYDYLAGSIESFPEQSKLTNELLDAGYSQVSSQGLTFGIVAIHHAKTAEK